MTLPDSVRPHRPRRETVGWAFGLVAFLVVVGIALLALRTAAQANHALQQDNAAQNAAVAELSTALNQTRSQLQQHGIAPKAPPPSTIIQGIPGATGPAGQSIVGPQGPPGKDGVSPDPAAIAAAAAALIHPSPGPVGPAGPQGVPGQNSNVPGPQGPAGSPGRDGSDGQPPAGWTTTYPDGSTETCQRAANFDPSNPWYSCTVSPPSSPPPSPAPGPTPSQSATTNTQSKTKPKSSAVVSTGPR